MRGALRLLSLALGLALAACSGPQPAPLPKAAAPDAAALAEAAMQTGSYAQAAVHYRLALAAQPDSIRLHYGLGVATSFLSQRDETAREFRWVVDRGTAGSEEVSVARNWLVQAGLLPREADPVRKAASSAGQPQAERGADPAILEGRAVFAEDGKTPAPMQRLQIFLVGQPDSPTKEERYVLRTDEEGRFKFANVVPGPYKLTNRIAGQPIWRLRVELKPSESKTLELTAANSVNARDDFPESR